MNDEKTVGISPLAKALASDRPFVLIRAEDVGFAEDTLRKHAQDAGTDLIIWSERRHSLQGTVKHFSYAPASADAPKKNDRLTAQLHKLKECCDSDDALLWYQKTTLKNIIFCIVGNSTMSLDFAISRDEDQFMTGKKGCRASPFTRMKRNRFSSLPQCGQR